MPAVHESAVAALEKKLRAKLPAAYRKFVAAYDGEAIGEEENPVACFFQILPDAPPSLANKILNAGSTLPDGMIPIGEDANRQTLMMQTLGADAGKIFRWDWEHERAVHVADAIDEEVVEPGPTIAESDLSQFEAKWKNELPTAYRAFLLRTNGGTTKSKSTYFCVDSSTGSDLRKQIETYRERIPKDVLPIARDWGGNLFLLCFRGKDLGKIFRWSHEEEADEGEKPSRRNVKLVAKDFAAFVKSLDDGPAWEPPL